HTNRCPAGVATQDPGLARALHVPNKIDRVANFQRGTVASAAQMVASMGLDGFGELTPAMLNRRIDSYRSGSYAEIYEWLMPCELLECPPEAWLSDWIEACAEEFV
ncbi:MAG: FMN-binding glutamate synthase family protein, partial [Mycobacterium sp.]|nr:FMN-binding glutamate synthase family protein [Mycobacterium sp.]